MDDHTSNVATGWSAFADMIAEVRKGRLIVDELAITRVEGTIALDKSLLLI